jgi:hypothetical protein
MNRSTVHHIVRKMVPEARKYPLILVILLQISTILWLRIAGWSSLVAREAHNLEVAGSNPAPATSL